MAIATEIMSEAPAATLSGKNETTEAWLNSHSLGYDFKPIQVSQIDTKSSLRNQARIGAPLNDDQVLMYASAMENGDLFPPIVVYMKPETKKYVVIDGNHRVAAYQMTNTAKVNAYVIDKPSNAQVLLLTFEANTKHGLPTSMDERLRQAVVLVEHGSSQTAAAQRLGIPIRRVENAIRGRKSDRRADMLGVNRRWHDLRPSTRQMFSALRNDNVFKAFADLVIVTGMGGQDVQSYISRLNEQPTEQKALDVVQSIYEQRKGEIRSTAGNRLGLNPRVLGFNAAIRKIVNTQVSDFTKSQMGADLKTRLRLSSVQALNRLAEIIETLEK